MKTTANVVWKGAGLDFEGVAPNGATLQMDDHGGFRPMHLLLLGLGGCTGMDVASILQKMRLEVSDVQVRVQAEQAEQPPKVYTDIVLTYVVRGRNIPPVALERAIELSQTVYCSASAMLGQSARLTTRYELIDDDTGTKRTGDPLARTA